MNLIKCPCVGCVVDACCTEVCYEMIKFVTFFIETKEPHLIQKHLTNSRTKDFLIDLNKYNRDISGVVPYMSKAAPGIICLSITGSYYDRNELLSKYQQGPHWRKEFR